MTPDWVVGCFGDLQLSSGPSLEFGDAARWHGRLQRKARGLGCSDVCGEFESHERIGHSLTVEFATDQCG